MTPLMMSALTSHTILKHNYYYATQHLHCDITDISNSPCNFDAGSLSIGWSSVRWRPVQLSRLPPLLRPDYSDYGQQGSVVRSK